MSRCRQCAGMVSHQINSCFILGVLLTQFWFFCILRLYVSSSVQFPKANTAGMSVVAPNSYFIPSLSTVPSVPGTQSLLWTLITLSTKTTKTLTLLHGLLLLFRFCLVRWCTFHSWGNMQKAFWKMEAVVAENSPNFRELPARLLPHCVHLEASKKRSR